MSMDEIQKKNDKDLKKHIVEKREELRGIRFSASGSGMRDTHSIKNTRREIAQSLTELNKRVREESNNDA